MSLTGWGGPGRPGQGVRPAVGGACGGNPGWSCLEKAWSWDQGGGGWL